MKLEHQQRIYDSLKIIAKDYETAAQLRRQCRENYGLEYEEALEMAYENMQEEAKNALKGLKRPI